jgi:hypothetical protein
MRHPKYPLLALGAYLALIGVFAISTAIPGQTQGGKPNGPDVRVVNTGAEAVPISIQGTAQIDTSSPIPVHDVDNVAQEPFHAAFTDAVPLTVPSGKRLVIEHVSGFAGVFEAVTLAVSIETKLGGHTINHAFPVTLAFDNGDTRTYTFGSLTRLYADPGTTVRARVNLTGNPAANSANCTLSGYLIDVP